MSRLRAVVVLLVFVLVAPLAWAVSAAVPVGYPAAATLTGSGARIDPPGAPTGDDQAGEQAPAAAQGSAARQRARSGADACDGPGMIWLAEANLCTHGSDPPPPGFDVDRRVPALPAARSARAAASFACDGDGQSGFRVQVLYVRASDVQPPKSFDELLPSLTAWTAEADDIVRQSAIDAGGGDRRFRFVTTAPGCTLDVRPVVVSPAGDNSFGSMVIELRSQGFNRTDRKYLTFVDTKSAGICGVGSVSGDDRPDQSNWNNVGPDYARVDAGCWGGFTAAHELIHNLGGIQDSAPNASGGMHCVDEYDVMCYSDSPYYPQMRSVCKDSVFAVRLDCNHDDYFHPAPPPGSYLDTHWNTANNQFLVADAANPAARITKPAARARVKANAPLTIAVAVSGQATPATVEIRFCPAANCRWENARLAGKDRSAPYSTVWRAPKAGTFTFLARVTGADGATGGSDPVTVSVAKDKKRKK